MNNEEKKDLLKECQFLIDEGEYNKVLSKLEFSDCVMSFWLKGLAYSSMAEDLSKNFLFISYATEEIKEKYRSLTSNAYDNLFKAVLLLPNSSLEIRDYLNPHIWNKIAKTEHEIARMRIVTDKDSSNSDFEECMDEQENTDYLIDQLSDWSL